MNLRQVRKQHGFSIAKLATEMGVQPHTVSRWETGTREPDATMLLKLANILGCSVDELLGGKSFQCSSNYPTEATAIFVETVDKLLDLFKTIDEPRDITEMVADLIQNGEVDDDNTRHFVQLIGEATAKSIMFLRQMSSNTPEAAEALAVIEKEMSHAA